MDNLIYKQLSKSEILSLIGDMGLGYYYSELDENGYTVFTGNQHNESWGITAKFKQLPQFILIDIYLAIKSTLYYTEERRDKICNILRRFDKNWEEKSNMPTITLKECIDNLGDACSDMVKEIKNKIVK